MPRRFSGAVPTKPVSLHSCVSQAVKVDSPTGGLAAEDEDALSPLAAAQNLS